MRTTLKASLLGMSAAALLVGTALGAGPAHALTVTATVEDDQTVSGTMKNEHNGPANCNVVLLKKSSLSKATAAVAAYEANNGVAWAQALSSMSDADAVGIAHKDAEAGESFDYTITPIAGGGGPIPMESSPHASGGRRTFPTRVSSCRTTST